MRSLNSAISRLLSAGAWGTAAGTPRGKTGKGKFPSQDDATASRVATRVSLADDASLKVAG